MQVSRLNQNGYQILNSSCPDSDSLHVFSGNLVRSIHLFQIPTPGTPLAFSLYHNSRDIGPIGEVGIGWRHSAQCELIWEGHEADRVDFVDESGRRKSFQKLEGQWTLQESSIFSDLQLEELGSGRWMLLEEPEGRRLEFQEEVGLPNVARLRGILDRSGNSLELEFDSSQQMVALLDVSSQRRISLDWSDGRLVGVTDPLGHRYTLSYHDDLLSAVEMPDGCLLEFTYDGDNRISSRSDRLGASTLYDYDELGRLLEIQGPLEGGVRPRATWSYSALPVEEVLNVSPLTDPIIGQFLELNQVLFTDAREKVWEYRFLPNSMLWREINPLGHHRRYFYDDKQNLLYSCEGFPRENLDDGSEAGNHDHPRDNFNSRFRFAAYDSKGNLTQSMDANGLVTTRSFGENSRPLMVYPGQAHCGVGGNWQGHFCHDGFVFCAHGLEGEDIESLPDYVVAIHKGSTLEEDLCAFDTDQMVLLSTQVLQGTGRIGRWTSETDSLDFSIELDAPKAFNLSLYTNSLDQLTGTGPALDYPELFGREMEFTVTDMRGSQTFHCTQNASSMWITFPVVGDEENPIVVQATCPQAEHRPCVSALAFDPFEDRRIRMEYSLDGFLQKRVEPTSDPGLEVSAEYSYHADSTLFRVSQNLRQQGELLDSRSTLMFYGDIARNLTGVQDALMQNTRLKYDLAGNLVELTDPEGKRTSFTYDYRGRVTSIRDARGSITRLSYDGRGLLTQMTDPLGSKTSFAYTPGRRLWKVTNALEEVTEYSYLADGLLHSITDPAEHVILFDYDDLGQLVQVIYPEREVVLPDFSRQVLSPQIRMAYDVWQRLVALTTPNGNLSNLQQINLVGSLNILRNGGAELESGTHNQVPLGWEQGRPEGLLQGEVRSSTLKNEGDFSFPLSVPDTLLEEESYDWVQRRPGGGPGGRYLMSGSARSDLATVFRLKAVVRQFSGALEEQSLHTSVSPDTWAELGGRIDLPGDAQVSATMPALHQFRAAIDGNQSGTTLAYLDSFQVRGLSYLFGYDGENFQDSLAPDGALFQTVRDRFGRVRRMLDPLGRMLELDHDALDRLVEVRDSQGLSLKFQYDFLGNLVKFVDSKEQETNFVYDKLNRVLEIIQPDEQKEEYQYSPAGNLTSYKDAQDVEKHFFYDSAHNLIRIDNLSAPTESVQMQYDRAGNLIRICEGNGDLLLVHYDALHRAAVIQRVSATGAQWTHSFGYDVRGRRIQLKEGSLPVYGQALYGTDAYLQGEMEPVFLASHDPSGRLQSLEDSLAHESTFAYDVEGRLVEVLHSNGTPALETRHRYDLVGRLLDTQLSQDEEILWGLSYGYNRASERLFQNSQWEMGEAGNSYRYVSDGSGRLVQESLNRFVVNRAAEWQAGNQRLTSFSLNGKLRLLERADSFESPYLDLQRWELALSEPVASAVEIRQNQGLFWSTSRGETLRNGRHMPAGTPYDGSNTSQDYPQESLQPVDAVGWFNGRILLRHRLPLVGAFDIRVAVSDFRLHDGFIGLGVTRERFDTSPAGSRYPTAYGGAVESHGCDLVLEDDGGCRFNEYRLAAETVTQLRLCRFLDGDWKLQAYYHDGEDWVSHANWVEEVDDQVLYAYLHLSGKLGSLRWSDFEDLVGSPFFASSIDMDEAVNQSAWPCYESIIYDAGRDTGWERIQWQENLPTNTNVLIQVATSQDRDGPWEFVGPDGEEDSYFTTPGGEDLPELTGRYCRFRAFLLSTDGLDSPELSLVQISCAGAESYLKCFSYDEAGNLTEIETYTATGQTSETRSFNELNELETRSDGWTFAYDANGSLLTKTNGAGIGDELWEYTWDMNNRLSQVKRGVYTSGEVLVNELTIDYSYDSMGRLLIRDDGDHATTFVWDGWDLLSETTDSVVTTYLVPEGLTLSFVRGGEAYQVHCDALGSVRVVTDEDGDIVARFEYGAWGELLPGSFDDVGLALRFVGGLGVRTDLDTGLYYMRHRWYCPASQRFISRDPIGLEGGANLFTYVENNPINWVDPSGLDLEVWMVPQGNPPTGNGHVWLEVSENGKSLFSLGAYAGTGKNLKSPDPHCGGVGARKIVSFPTDHEKNLQMISEFKNLINNQKPGEWYANPRDPNPDRYFKEVDLFGVVKYRTLNPDTMRVCTTVARELVDKTIKPGPDKRLPPLFQPNNLWNHYHPKNRLPAGQFNFKGHPAPP